MRGIDLRLILMVLFALPLASCKDSGAAMTGTPSEVQSDVSRLGELIQLPYAPSSARWLVVQKGEEDSGLGPTDWVLMAVLTFNAQDTATLRQETAALEPLGSLKVEPGFLREWFPSDVTAAFVAEAGSELLTLALPRFEARIFAKAPLLSGYFLVTNEGTVFLYMFTT